MTTMAENKMMENQARAGWYQILAGVFAEEPKKEFLRELREQTFQQALAELGANFDDDFLKPELDELAETLACEYTMLFVAPGGFPAVESVRLQGGFRQSAAMDVKMIYGKEGFSAKTGSYSMFDDHLAVELAFVGALLQKQAEAIGRGDETEEKRLEKLVKRFWVQHLGRWVRGFGSLVEEAAAHSFYREMGILLVAFGEAELDVMGLNVVDDDGSKWRAPKPSSVTKPMQCGGAAG